MDAGVPWDRGDNNISSKVYICSYRGDGGGDRGSSKCPMYSTALITLVTKLTVYTNNLLTG